MPDTQSDIHNRLSGEIVSDIVRPIIEAGGGPTQIWTVVESVLVGICLFTVKIGGDEKLLDLMVVETKKRLAELRLGDIKTKGSA